MHEEGTEVVKRAAQGERSPARWQPWAQGFLLCPRGAACLVLDWLRLVATVVLGEKVWRKPSGNLAGQTHSAALQVGVFAKL